MNLILSALHLLKSCCCRNSPPMKSWWQSALSPLKAFLTPSCTLLFFSQPFKVTYTNNQLLDIYVEH